MQFTRKWGLQLAATALAALALFTLSHLPFDWARELREQTQNVITQDAEFDAQVPLAYVAALFPQAHSVFAPQQEPFYLQRPAAGILAQNDTACAILCEDTKVYACAPGQVFYAGQEQVILVHDQGYQTRYYGLTPTVKAGQRLERGEVLGEAEPGSTLRLELLQDGRTLSPTEYLAVSQ